MDVGTILGLICVLVTFFLFIKNFEKGMLCFIILLFVSPNIFDFSYELIAFPLLIFGCILSKNGKTCLFHELDFCDDTIVACFFLGIISSVLSAIINKVSINYIGLFGFFRIILLGFIFRQYFSYNYSYKINTLINTVFIINVIACVIQLLVPQSVNLFFDLYYKSSMTPLKYVVEIGYFNRLFGTFGTPVSLAILFNFIFAFYFYKWYVNDTKGFKYLFCIIVLLLLGILTYSKTFYFGVPIIVISTIILARLQNKKINYLFKFGIMMLGITALFLLLITLAKTNSVLQFYLNYFKNPLGIFETRYGDNGILNITKIIIRDNIFIGVGDTNLIGEFVGDSAYYSLLHYGGLIGLGLYLFSPAYCFISSYKDDNIVGCIFIIILLICGTASTIFTMIFASIAIGVSGKKVDVVPLKTTSEVLNGKRKIFCKKN